MPRPTPYSPEENATLRQLYPTASRAELLAALPNRTTAAIRCQAVRLKLTKAEPKQVWTSEEDAVLRARYHEDGPQRLAKKLGRAPQGVKRRAGHLGLTSRQNMAPRLDRAPRAPRVAPTTTHNPSRKSTTTLKPLAVGAQREPVEPVKRSPATPILNAGVENRRREQSKVKAQSIVEEIKALPANSEGRSVYMRAASQGGPAATAAFREWQRQQAA